MQSIEYAVKLYKPYPQLCQKLKMAVLGVGLLCTIQSFIPYVYGTYRMHLCIRYDHTCMTWLFIPYATIAYSYTTLLLFTHQSTCSLDPGNNIANVSKCKKLVIIIIWLLIKPL